MIELALRRDSAATPPGTHARRVLLVGLLWLVPWGSLACFALTPADRAVALIVGRPQEKPA